MSTKKLIFYLSAVLLGGCVPVMSLHSLYNKEDVIFDEKLLGTWVDDPNNPETTWEFMRIVEPNNAYKLIFSDKEGQKGSFDAYLIKLKERFFLDLHPSDPPWEPEDPNKLKWPFNTLFLIPTHTFIKIDSLEPQLKMRLTLEDEMQKLLKEDPNAVQHTFIEDRLILTASTKELQAFVLKYADDDRLFTDETVLSRKETKKPNSSKAIEPKQ